MKKRRGKGKGLSKGEGSSEGSFGKELDGNVCEEYKKERRISVERGGFFASDSNSPLKQQIGKLQNEELKGLLNGLIAKEFGGYKKGNERDSFYYGKKDSNISVTVSLKKVIFMEDLDMCIYCDEVDNVEEYQNHDNTEDFLCVKANDDYRWLECFFREGQLVIGKEDTCFSEGASGLCVEEEDRRILKQEEKTKYIESIKSILGDALEDAPKKEDGSKCLVM